MEETGLGRLVTCSKLYNQGMIEPGFGSRSDLKVQNFFLLLYNTQISTSTSSRKTEDLY